MVVAWAIAKTDREVPSRRQNIGFEITISASIKNRPRIPGISLTHGHLVWYKLGPRALPMRPRPSAGHVLAERGVALESVSNSAGCNMVQRGATAKKMSRRRDEHTLIHDNGLSRLTQKRDANV